VRARASIPAAAYGALCLLLIGAVALQVDLAPRVERDFFFSSDEPSVATDERISRLFAGAGGSQVILDVAGDPGSADHVAAVAALTRALERVPGTADVISLTAGPKSPRHALESPFWSRLVGSARGGSTRVLVALDERAGQRTIAAIETIVREHERPGLPIRASGVPYVIEQVRRSLVRDMLVFSGAAFLLFGLIVALLFRSAVVMAGTLVSCISAACLTLLATHLLEMRIGVLTANLTTIVFIMTLHHVVYMTYAWRGAAAQAGAVRESVADSAWVMLTTLLGFGSLVLVPAEPLRQLGIAGGIGAVIAFAVAAAVHPTFLSLARERRGGQAGAAAAVPSLLAFPRFGIVAAFIALAVLLATGIPRLNRDPSLETYFARGSEIREGLERIDRGGGSSPLRLVVRDRAGDRLDAGPAYRRLSAVQRELERDPAVGTSLSLPLIVAEAKDRPLGFLLPRRFLLERMERPKHGSITHVFVTEDRERALFLLRMREAEVRQARLATVERLARIVEAHGFEVEMVGGLYHLQGHLAGLVGTSLITGVGQLLAGFLIVGALVSRSVRSSIALLATLGLVPAIVLGLMGWLRVPLDIISAPAVNIALGMAIDDMLHLAARARRLRREGLDAWSAWVRARATQWRPLLATLAIVCSGFAIFLLSSFPPTRRFGAAVVLGGLVDGVACLFVLPLLAGFPLVGRLRSRRATGTSAARNAVGRGPLIRGRLRP
jgi:predicted RND superfamily exporter protein